MVQRGADEPFEGGDEPMRAVGRKIETEEFDRDEPVVLGIERPEDRAESAGADLMKNPKRTERVRMRGSSSVRVQ